MYKYKKYSQIFNYGLGLFFAVSIGISTVAAQEFPTRPVTLVVPYPAGGGADIIARMLAESMKPFLGQAVTVTNRPGGQGTIGTAEVIGMPPDGYNLVLSAAATLTVQPHRQDLPYNTPNDYDPIIKAANLPMVLAVLSNSQWKSSKELIEYARANPGKVRVGSPGNGSVGHLIIVSVNKKAGIKLGHVPYASGAESIPSMLGGHIEAVVAHPSELLPHVKAKTVTVLGVFEDQRNANFPAAPTFREMGYDVSMGVYYPVVAPKNLPADVKLKLYKSAKAAIESPAFKAQAKERGYNLEVKDPEALRKDLWIAYQANGKLVNELGLGKK
ncbi:tripartite tricarboxylate transporter substrate binding protein [Polynucleobacter sp. IMCC 30228]|uniref:Bug family tripartite tricarboxylate transporter substrate binding protein n=1 Tax=Polynucleobacter sp. IMCC 30228 TaxID=2781011 RepID=UPI001F323662|nr:tripartite tricarboxylate transporter substrate binding protein [Polynucleobacter sp. IMCC 30228]MCE7527517.1 tripartite tricarboxylate transporter substrate binding protein [Polynucleobacter sp. IMCC 30228]